MDDRKNDVPSLLEKHGNQALIWLARQRNEPDPILIAKLLKRKPELLNTKDADNITALMHASANGHTNLVEQLIRINKFIHAKDEKKAYAFINAHDNDNLTALIHAAENGHAEITQLLIDANAALDIRERNEGCTALILAAGRGYTAIVEQLIAAGASIDFGLKNAMIEAAHNHHLDIIYELLEEGASLDKKPDGITAVDAFILGRATNERTSNEKCLEIIYLLLSHDASVNKPANLFSFLLECDQSDPKVLLSMFALYCQQEQLIEAKETTAGKLSEEKFNTLQKYIQSLIKVFNVTTLTDRLLDETTEQHFSEKGIREIIRDYDDTDKSSSSSASVRLRLFNKNKDAKTMTPKDIEDIVKTLKK